MKLLLATLFATATLGLALPAQAEVLDMSTLKCSDTANWSENEAALVMFWLHGYYGGQAGDTTVDFDALTTVATKLGEVCAENPDVGIMTALKSVVGE